MDWTIQEVARRTGVTSRTLRHYHAVGLLPPARVAGNGHRRYGRGELVRLQRILLLRGLGLGLPQIRSILDGQQDDAAALAEHLELLNTERRRLQDQIRAVRATLDALSTGKDIMAEEMFQGFDHTRYRGEVVERWGEQAYKESDRWWRSLDAGQKEGFHAEHAALQDAWDDLQRRGLPPNSADSQDVAARHAQWIGAGTGGRRPGPQMLLGLAEMYAADERFAANYTREFEGGARYVRDALVYRVRGGQD